VWIPSTRKSDAGAKGFQCPDEEGRLEGSEFSHNMCDVLGL
jgi:hypothetical protein